jgi:hypothetical protein
VATTLTEQTRYATSDLLMAGDTKIFSRFMLTPTRTDDQGKLLTGGDAIASAGLGAFLGFACPEFMRFDYLLGRKNCQQFLREQFVLGDQNPLFVGWTPGERVDFRQAAGAGFLPIIPLVGSAAVDAAAEGWPKSALDPNTFRGAIEARFRAIFQLELSGDIGKSALAWIGAQVTQKQAADYIINAMNAYLQTAGLA